MRTWVLRRFRTYGQRCLLLGVFFAPLAFHSGTLDVFNLFKLWVLWVFGMLAACLWLVWSLERGIWIPRFKIGYVAAIFLVAVGLATVFSQSPLISLFGRYHRYGGFIQTALYVLMTFVLVGLFWEQPGRLSWAVTVFAGSSAVVALYAISQAAGVDPIEWQLGGGAPRFSLSTLGNPNFAGGYLAICVPFLIFVMSSSKRPFAHVLSGLAIVGFVGLWVTGSRGGLAGTTAGVAALTFFRRDEIHVWIKRAIGGFVALVLVLAVLVIWHPGLDQPPAGLGRLGVFQKESLIERQNFWRAGLLNFFDHPLLGTGPETFYAVYGRYRAAGAEAQGILSDKPHNIFIEYASSTGIVGLGAYLALVCLALWYAGRAASRPDHPNRGLLVTFAASFVAYLAQGFFSIDVPPLAVMGWFGLGAIAVLADPGILSARAAREAVIAAKLPKGKGTSAAGPDYDSMELVASRKRNSVPGSVRAIQASAAVVTSGVLALGTAPVIADARARTSAALALQATISDPEPTLQQALNELNRAIRLNPLEASYHQSAARYLLQLAGVSEEAKRRASLFRQASVRLSRAHELEPDNIYIAMSLGRLHSQWARQGNTERFETAAKWWRRAVALEPENWEVQYRFGAFLNEWGVRSKRPEIIRASIPPLEKSTQLRPDLAHLWTALGQSLLALDDKQGAKRAFTTALSLAPGDPAAARLLTRATAPE